MTSHPGSAGLGTAEPGTAEPGSRDRDRALLANLQQIDTALLGLRHLWSMSGERPAALGGVEMSTVWVVDALDRDGSSEGMSVAEVAGALDVAPSTASRLVERALRAGMVARERSGADARKARVSLTAEGRALVDESRSFRIGYLARVTTGWTPQDQGTFAVLLARFADAARNQPSPAPDTRGTPR